MENTVQIQFAINHPLSPLGKVRGGTYILRKGQNLFPLCPPPSSSFGNTNLSANIRDALSAEELSPSFAWLPYSKFQADLPPRLTTSIAMEEATFCLWAWTFSQPVSCWATLRHRSLILKQGGLLENIAWQAKHPWNENTPRNWGAPCIPTPKLASVENREARRDWNLALVLGIFRHLWAEPGHHLSLLRSSPQDMLYFCVWF